MHTIAGVPLSSILALLLLLHIKANRGDARTAIINSQSICICFNTARILGKPHLQPYSLMASTTIKSRQCYVRVKFINWGTLSVKVEILHKHVTEASVKWYLLPWIRDM